MKTSSKTPKKFIAKAIKKEGVLKKKALAMGLVKNTDENLSETDLEKIEKLGGVWQKRVNLARTLKGFHKQGGGAGNFFDSLSKYSKKALAKTKELAGKASTKTKEGYASAKKYTEQKIHDQKQKIALEVIDDTKDNVSGNKYKIVLAGAEELITEAYKAGGSPQAKVEKVMHEFKEGTLKSHGHKVTERSQAIAIALSEAGLSKKWSGGETYKDGGDTPKKIDIATTKKIKNQYGKYVVGLITKDYIYFINPEEGDDNANTIMYNKEGVLLSDNYFASDDLFGRLTDIANKRESYEYIRPAIKKYLKEYKEEKVEQEKEESLDVRHARTVAMKHFDELEEGEDIKYKEVTFRKIGNELIHLTKEKEQELDEMYSGGSPMANEGGIKFEFPVFVNYDGKNYVAVWNIKASNLNKAKDIFVERRGQNLNFDELLIPVGKDKYRKINDKPFKDNDQFLDMLETEVDKLIDEGTLKGHKYGEGGLTMASGGGAGDEENLMKKNGIILIGNPSVANPLDVPKTIEGQIAARKENLKNVIKSMNDPNSDIYPEMEKSWKKSHEETLEKLYALKKSSGTPMKVGSGVTSADLPKDGSEIKIHMPALGHLKAEEIILKYDKKNFMFDIYADGKKQRKISEQEVLDNIRNGLYVIKSSGGSTMAGGGDVEVSELSTRIGIGKVAVQKWLDKNGLSKEDALKILTGLGRNHFEVGEVVTAIIGDENNQFSKELVAYSRTDKAYRKSMKDKKFAIGEKVLYVPKLSGFDNTKPLVVEHVVFKEGDDLTKKGYQYTFKNSDLAAHEDDLTSYENLLLGIGTKINIPEFGGDKNVKMTLMEVVPLSKADIESGLGAISYHFKGSKNRNQWYPETKLKQRLDENSIEIVKRMDNGGDDNNDNNTPLEQEPIIESITDSDNNVVSTLKSFVESNDKLSQEKEQIYNMATDMKWDADRLHKQFQRIFSYMAETSYNKQNPETPIELTEDQRNEFANLYAPIDNNKPQSNVGEATPVNHLEQTHEALEKVENATIATQSAVQEAEHHLEEAKQGVEGEPSSFKDGGVTSVIDPKKINKDVFYIGEPVEEKYINKDLTYWKQKVGGESAGGGKAISEDHAADKEDFDIYAKKWGIKRITEEQWTNMTPPFNKKELPEVKQIEKEIDDLKKALNSSKTKASGKEKIKKKLDKLEAELDDILNPKPKKGKYYVDIDLKYRRKMIPEINKAKLKVSTVALGDQVRILMDTDMKQQRVFDIYNTVRKKSNDTPVNMESATGTLKKLGRKHILKLK